MDIARLKAEPREAHGTRAARRLRRAGKLPGIIYGHGEKPEAVAVPIQDLGNLVEHGAHVVELQIEGGNRPVLIKDVQFDHIGIDPVHVDFTRVDMNEHVKVRVPLEFRGTPVGVNEGGLLDHDMVDMEVECLVLEIPASIRVNVANLKLGQSLHVKDVELPSNVKAVTSPDAIVCSVRVKAAEVEAVAAATEEAPAQPEIIGRQAKEEEPAEETGGKKSKE